jgi:hypothetical protein
MNILICSDGVFDSIGGGQTFFLSLIRSNPAIRFFCFQHGLDAPAGVPDNVTLLPVEDLYRKYVDHVDLVEHRLGGVGMQGKSYDILQLLDLARAAQGLRFDVVDIPDYMPFMALFPEALRLLGVGVDKVAVSMHGTLSDGLTGNWADVLDTTTRSLLEIGEDWLYRTADIRYGISDAYLDEWERRTGVRGDLVDLWTFFRLDDFAALRNGAPRDADESPPDLVFTGRQEKWKGPDLFVEIAGNLSREIYGLARLIGSPVNLHDRNSAEALSAMAGRRGLEIVQQTLPRPELLKAFARENWFVVAPSRKDTFNFVALEALLCGAPCAISSKAGVARYLRESMPDVPFVEIDPDDTQGATGLIRQALGSYSEIRASQAKALRNLRPIRRGKTYLDICGGAGSADAAIREDASHVMRTCFAAIEAAARPAARSEIRHRFSGDLSAILEHVEPDLAPVLLSIFDNSVAFQEIGEAARAEAARTGFLSDLGMSRLHKELGATIFSGDRVPAYRLLAELERGRGNDLLWATYHLRCFRLGGRRDDQLLGEVVGVLQAAGFVEEASAAMFLYASAPDRVGAKAYLESMLRRFPDPPKGGIAKTLDKRTVAAPKVSVIVSLWKAAGKLPLFLEGLHQVPADMRARMEIVLVDSASPDDTETVVKQELKRRGADAISTLYIRSDARETIQKAWNRGIAAASGAYLSFLGVDEMNHPSAFGILSDYLDSNPGVDWAQGTALVTDVSMAGSFEADVMLYDRRFDADFMNIFDTCYIGYVGALYRKSLHKRVGYYDDRFRGAGDSEFKNRALPHMTAMTLPVCLGYFLNYPEERTTQSPMAEIEDLRAWYLHRTPEGAGVAFSDDPEEMTRAFRAALGYRKSYMTGRSTDLELASAISARMAHIGKDSVSLVGSAALVPALRDIYRSLDTMSDALSGLRGMAFTAAAADHLRRCAIAIAGILRILKAEKSDWVFTFTNDNRSHQHHYLWQSRSARIAIEPRLSIDDLAGPRDCAELLSSCLSDDEQVDFESARRSDKLFQLRRLVVEKSIDLAVICDASLVPACVAAANAGGVRRFSNAVVFLNHGLSDFPREATAGAYFTGRIATQRPLLAAARITVVAEGKGDPDLAVGVLVQVASLGVPVVTTPKLLAMAQDRLPGRGMLKDVAVAADIAGIIATAARLARDDKELDAYRAAMRRIASDIRKHQRTVAAGESDVAPLPEFAETIAANRQIRHVYETSGVAGVKAMVADADADDLRRSIAQALFDRKTAPILKTSQPVFKRIRAETAGVAPESSKANKAALRGRVTRIARA